MNKFFLAVASLLFLGVSKIIFAANYPDPTGPFRGQPNPVYAEMTSKYGYSFSSTWANIPKPFPTNAWFTNLPNIPIVGCAKVDWEGNVPLCGNIQPKPSDECFGQAWCPQRFIPNLIGTINSNFGATQAPVVPYPYLLGKSPTGGLKVVFSSTPTGTSNANSPIRNNQNLPFAVLWDPAVDIEIGAMEFGSLTAIQPAYKMKSFTPLSATLIMKGPQGFGNEFLEAPIVRGSPYITVKYNDLTPRLTFDGVSISEINGITQPPATLPAGTKFKITENQTSFGGKNWKQVWIVYFSSSVTPAWKLSKDKSGGNQDILVLDKPYNGTVRLALLSDDQGVNNTESILDQYSDTIPTGGQVNYSITNNIITETFTWNTENNQPPLIMALPHQQQTFINTPLVPEMQMPGNKGIMKGVAQSTWTMQEAVPSIPLLEITDKTKFTQAQQTEILNALSNDVQMNPGFTGSYTAGKIFARFARLALIANLLGDDTSKTTALTKIETNMEKWMNGNTDDGDNLFYDTTIGGIVPSHDDFQAMNKYDDHHFHYGYFVYTIAVMAKLDSTWANTPIIVNGSQITPIDWAKFLIRDYANPNSDDTFFPRLRTQDDYDGHSWASGLEVTGDGKNQESISEAVNAYYAIALLGDQIQDSNLSNWGRFLLARELRAAKTYWQITPSNCSQPFSPPIYDPSYPYYVATNVWNNKIDFHTFFGGIGYASYGIEMLPFTAITPTLLKPWITCNDVQSDLTASVTYAGTQGDGQPWIDLLLKGQALGTPNDPKWWDAAAASDQTKYDNGDSKTNTLYAIASYPLLP
jgi:endo-1,3(4)-beta-glucanase